MKVSNIPLIATPQDLSVALELDTFYTGNIVCYSIQIVFTGVPAGEFKLQCSNDQNKPPSIWTDITDSTQIVRSAGNHVWNVQDCGYLWARAVWTPSGGSGVLVDARAVVKGV